MEESKTNISSVGDLLQKDTKGDYKKELISRFENEALMLKNTINKGLSPELYEKKTSMMLALLASIEVVENTWDQYHLVK